MKVIQNPDKSIVDTINAALSENKAKYGKLYCPCVLPSAHNDDTVCMCKEFREKMVRGEPGECHCGKYVVVADE